MKYEYTYEYTDTFGGEANYCWVRRGRVKASSLLGAARIAKRELGLNGVRCRVDTFGDMNAYYPQGSCTVLFVSEQDLF